LIFGLSTADFITMAIFGAVIRNYLSLEAHPIRSHLRSSCVRLVIRNEGNKEVHTHTPQVQNYTTKHRPSTR